jgi:hypothetical protein
MRAARSAAPLVHTPLHARDRESLSAACGIAALVPANHERQKNMITREHLLRERLDVAEQELAAAVAHRAYVARIHGISNGEIAECDRIIAEHRAQVAAISAALDRECD